MITKSLYEIIRDAVAGYLIKGKMYTQEEMFEHFAKHMPPLINAHFDYIITKMSVEIAHFKRENAILQQAMRMIAVGRDAKDVVRQENCSGCGRADTWHPECPTCANLLDAKMQTWQNSWDSAPPTTVLAFNAQENKWEIIVDVYSPEKLNKLRKTHPVGWVKLPTNRGRTVK